MSLPISTTKERVLTDLRPLFPFLSEAFDVGITECADYFAARGRRVDSYLGPHLVRYRVKEFLGERGLLVSEIVVDDSVPNNGLDLRYGSYHIRIWKTGTGDLPDPGVSLRKSLFLHQRQPLQFEFYAQAPRSHLNLAVLWSVNATFGLDKLYLVCPKGDLANSSPIEVEWKHEIKHLAVLAQRDLVVESPTIDLPFEIVDSDKLREEAKNDLWGPSKAST